MAKERNNKAEDFEDPLKDEDEAAKEVFTDLRSNSKMVEVPDDEGIGDDIDEDLAELAADDDGEASETGEDEGDKGGEGGGDQQSQTSQPQLDSLKTQRFELKKARLQALGAEAETVEAYESSSKVTKANAERLIQSIPDKIKKAKEDGDTTAEMALQQEYLDARDALKTANENLQKLEGRKAAIRRGLAEIGWNGKEFVETEDDKKAYAAAGGNPQGTGTPPRASKNSDAFLKANPWFSDEKFKDQRERILKMDRALKAEGTFDIDDPKYFDELVTRFNRVETAQGRQPLARNLTGKLAASGERRRGNGAGTGNSAMPTGGSNGQRSDDATAKVLTKQDLSAMRRFGMDPQSKEDRKAWLTEKRALN